LKDIIKRSGDTSANGAIIGGLIGASRGHNEINQAVINKLLNVNE